MKPAKRNYARIYYDEFMAEYPGVYDDDAAFAAWTRLLILAEKMWPQLPEMPRRVKDDALAVLVAVGLVALEANDRYRIRGLDAERSRRSAQGKAGADARWNADSNADRNSDAHADAMPRQDEKETSYPLTPTSGGNGSPRANGTNPRAIAAALTRENERAAKERKARREARKLAYLDGRITAELRDEMDACDAPLDLIPQTRGAAYSGALS